MARYRTIPLVFALIVCASLSVFSEAPLRLRVNPGVILPLGGNAPFFRTGAIATIDGTFVPERLSWFSLNGELGYSYNKYGVSDALSVASAGAGVGLVITPAERFFIQGGAAGGFSLSLLSISRELLVGPGVYVSAGAGAFFRAAPWLDIGVSLGYRNVLGVYSGVFATLGTALRIAGSGGDSTTDVRPPAAGVSPLQGQTTEGNLLQVKDLVFLQIFPIFYSYYDDHPVGDITVHNPLSATATNITVSLFVNQYMDAPKKAKTVAELKPEEDARIDLMALFTDRMLEITEGTKVAAEIVIEYSVGAQRFKDTHIESINMEYRNAMTWDDDRKAAAFVTARDPQVLRFSNNVAGMIKGGEYQVNANLQKAIAFHEALRLLGMAYVIDPNTPYEALSEKVYQVDTLKFPRESLAYKAGDCDDLSILYSALFESVGIETAFITIPGHIFLAFSTGLDSEAARGQFNRTDDLIFQEEKAWIPLEITALERGFLEAWQMGAKEWRENKSRNQAAFFPIREAWQVYSPVGLPGAAESIQLPEKEQVLAAYTSQVVKFVDQEIYQQVATVRSQIRESNDPNRYMNRLGILYAKYGLYDRALVEFENTLSAGDYFPALLNIGNIHFLREELKLSREFYERAMVQKPEDAKVILSVARVNHELENYGFVRELYEKLQKLDAALAEEYAYLDLRGDEAARAAEVSGARKRTLWAEE
ncbi:MAG: hypothetical protein JW852_11095 [Spirochaetales bacterium]|nr:hypothetical protein [Spirochaetales bacterium]